MKTHISIDAYHSAIISSITRDFSEYQTVTDYLTVDSGSPLKVPAALVQVTDMAPAEARGEALLEWTVKASLFIAVANTDSASEDQRKLRQLAVDMANYFHSNSFGLPIGNGRVMDCRAGALATEQHDSIVYEVKVEHDVQFSVSNLYPDLNITDVWLGCAPEIGTDHVDDYDQLVKDGEPV